MQWIVMGIGLAILILLAVRTVRRPVPASLQTATHDEGLNAYLQALAARPLAKRKARFRACTGLSRRLEHSLKALNRSNEMLPASEYLLGYGRFLQQETASLARTATQQAPLPATEDLQIRVMVFARALLSHTRARLSVDGLCDAAEAWQQQSPFTVEETEALPHALRLVLLELLADLCQYCVREQALIRRVDETVLAIVQRHKRKAGRIFEKSRHHHLYLARLTEQLRNRTEPEAAVWYRQLIHSHGIEKTTQDLLTYQTEQMSWIVHAIASLKEMSGISWDRLLERLSIPHRLLSQDKIYVQMDQESRLLYRRRVSEISRAGQRTEAAVCDAVHTLRARFAAGDVRAHTGYYLLDEGLAQLLHTLHIPERILPKLSQREGGTHRALLPGIFLATTLSVALSGASPWLWLPVSIVGSVSLWWFIGQLTKRRRLLLTAPRMALNAIPDDARTLVVCPAVLSSGEDALQAVRHLAILRHANPDPNLHFLLAGDFGDSLTGASTTDEDVVSAGAQAIHALCAQFGEVFFFLHRERFCQMPDHTYMGRERAFGFVETVMKLMTGAPADDRFVYASVNPEALRRYRYLIVLDRDVQMPAHVPWQLVGAMLHPLHRRQELEGQLRGVSIITPRTTADVSRMTSRFPLVGSSPSGLSMGNGWIIDPAACLAALDGQFLPGVLIDKSLLATQLAGSAPADDLVVYKPAGNTLRAAMERLQLTTRGLWQLLPYAVPRLGKALGLPANVLPATHRRNLLLKIGATLFRPLQLTAIALGIVLGEPLLAFLCVLASDIFLLVSRKPRKGAAYLQRLMLLPQTAVTQGEAACRALYRVLVSRRGLLDETMGTPIQSSIIHQDLRSFYISMASAGGSALICLLPGAARWAGILLAILWLCAPVYLQWLESTASSSPQPSGYMREVLKRLAGNTLLFFETAISEDAAGLPPAHVQIDPNKGIAAYASPGDTGLYLCGLLCAQKLGLLSVDDLCQRIRRVVAALEATPKWNGHPYSRIDVHTLEPIHPRKVNTQSSGMLAVCLVTAAQGLRCLLGQLTARDEDLPKRLDALAGAMQFAPLYDPDAELFYEGYNAEREQPTREHHKLLADESQLTSYFAIMTGQAPIRHWQRLQRTRVNTRQGQTLLSAHGAMSEYLTASLFLRLHPFSMLYQTEKSAAKAQQKQRVGGLNGLSDSGYYAFDPQLNYLSKAFGLRQLAVEPDVAEDVIAPYATVLALQVNPQQAFKDLLRLQSMGLEGPLGLFEAADFNRERIKHGQPMGIVHSHTARHQGLILCAIGHFLCNQLLADLFTGLPQAQAYRHLLDEPMIREAGVPRRPFSERPRTEKRQSRFASHSVPTMCFPIRAHVLHGAGVTLVTDAQGGGYISKDGRIITRFHQSCHRPSGPRFYLKDSQSGRCWVAVQPGCEAVFESAQAVYTQSCEEVLSQLRVFVDPLSGAVVHLLTVENQAQTQRMLEVCSYLEPAVHGQACLTRKLPPHGVCLSNQEDEAQRLWHTLVTDATLTSFHTQTDRNGFLGLGGSIYAPREMELPLSGLADRLGVMPEPCLSLRGQFVLQAGEGARFFFVTHQPGQKEREDDFLRRCDRPDSILEGYDIALTQALVTMDALALTPEEQALLPALTGMLVYTGQPTEKPHTGPDAPPLPNDDAAKLPLVALECHDQSSLADAALMLRLHALLCIRGLRFRLVLIAREEASPALYRGLKEAVRHSPGHEWMDSDTLVSFVETKDKTQRNQQLTHAQLVLSTSEGPLADQLSRILQPAQGRPVYRTPPPDSRPALPKSSETLLGNQLGAFSRESGGYAITLAPGQQPLAHWCNPLLTPQLGVIASESGLLGAVYPLGDEQNPSGWEESFFLRDENQRIIWSPTRQPLGARTAVRVTHSPGETLYESSGYGIYCKLHCAADPVTGLGIRLLQLKNQSEKVRLLTFCHALVISGEEDMPNPFSATDFPGGICLESRQKQKVFAIFGTDPEPLSSAAMSAGAFQGLWGAAPAALSGAALPPSTEGEAMVLLTTIPLKPGESRSVTCAVGCAKQRSGLLNALQQLKSDGATQRLHQVRQYWEQLLLPLQFDLPDAALSLMLNRWLPYQAQTAAMQKAAVLRTCPDPSLSRELLASLPGLMITAPEAVREALLLCAACPPKKNEAILLVEMTALYLKASGDHQLLKAEIPEQSQTLWQRCMSIVQALPRGAHGLPMDKDGESARWGMRLCEALRLLRAFCEPEKAKELKEMHLQLLSRLDNYAWNGSWYLSGWPAEGETARSGIDLETQCLAVQCGVSRDRCATAMENVWRLLYHKDAKLLAQYALPGGEEAGSAESSQSSAGIAQVIIALHQLGDDERAWEMALNLLPTTHAATPQLAQRYRGEPYAMADQIHTTGRLRGRAHQDWNTCGASWYIHAVLNQLLGFKKDGDQLQFRPVLPQSWEHIHLTYRYRTATYHLHASRDCLKAVSDGEPLSSGQLTLKDDGRIHEATFPAR